MIIDDDTQQLRCSAGRSSVVFFRAWTRTDVERERYGSDGRAVILSATDPLPHARHTQLDSPWGPVTRRCGRFLFASNRSHRRSTSPIKMHRAPQETERNAYRPEESIQPPRSLFLFPYRKARKRINPRTRELFADSLKNDCIYSLDFYFLFYFHKINILWRIFKTEDRK